MTKVVQTDEAGVRLAGGSIASGGLVVFPTETVYGIGADRDNRRAVERLCRVKGRSTEKPLTIHIAAKEEIEQYVAEVSAAARKLIARYWPGPLTLVLPGRGGETIGFRLPDDRVARAIIRASGVTVVASSANRSGEAPACSAEEALSRLKGEVDVIVDAGGASRGVASTVVRLVGGKAEVLREGAIAASELAEALEDEGGLQDNTVDLRCR